MASTVRLRPLRGTRAMIASMLKLLDHIAAADVKAQTARKPRLQVFPASISPLTGAVTTIKNRLNAIVDGETITIN